MKRIRMSSDVFRNNDILEEILVRVPPEFISKPILVSKRWLRLIRNASFRKYYTKRWSRNFPLMGFMGFYVRNNHFFRTPIKHDGSDESYDREEYDWENAHRFWSSCKEGDEQSRQGYRIFGPDDYLIDSSSNGILLIGRLSYPFTFIVWNPFTEKHHQLPQPRENYQYGCMAFEVEYYGKGLFHYKVTRVKAVVDAQALDAISIQTFSSTTGRWEETTLSSSEDMTLAPWMTGIVIGGVIHWRLRTGGVAIYDPNRGNQPLAYIRSPDDYCPPPVNMGTVVRYFPRRYGVSGEGLLQCASMAPMSMKIHVLEIEHPDYSTYNWSFRYKVDFEKQIKDLGPCEDLNHFFCVSFLPRNSEYIFLRLNYTVFLLHIPSEKWEHVPYENEPLSDHGYKCFEAIPYFKWECPCPDLLS